MSQHLFSDWRFDRLHPAELLGDEQVVGSNAAPGDYLASYFDDKRWKC